MKTFVVVASVILFIASLVHSAAIEDPAVGPSSTAPVSPGLGPRHVPGGDLNTDATFWWPWWGGWGWGGYGGFGGYGGGWGGGHGGWGPYY